MLENISDVPAVIMKLNCEQYGPQLNDLTRRSPPAIMSSPNVALSNLMVSRRVILHLSHHKTLAVPSVGPP
jgi:hypothetical protein